MDNMNSKAVELYTPKEISTFAKEIAEINTLSEAVEYINEAGLIGRDTWVKVALVCHKVLTPLTKGKRGEVYKEVQDRLHYSYAQVRNFRQAGEYLAQGKALNEASKCFSVNEYLSIFRNENKKPVVNPDYIFDKKLFSYDITNSTRDKDGHITKEKHSMTGYNVVEVKGDKRKTITVLVQDKKDFVKGDTIRQIADGFLQLTDNENLFTKLDIKLYELTAKEILYVEQSDENA